MFAFVFVAVLFVFAYESPAFALLFALPPNRTPKGQTTVMFLFKVVARAARPHGYSSRKCVAFLNLFKNVLYFR